METDFEDVYKQNEYEKMRRFQKQRGFCYTLNLRKKKKKKYGEKKKR